MDERMLQLKAALETVRGITDLVPETGIVLGSGLGNFAEQVDVKAEVPYCALEGFPVSTVPGHDGRFIFGEIEGQPVVLMKGRVHYYEGYDMQKVVSPKSANPCTARTFRHRKTVRYNTLTTQN